MRSEDDKSKSVSPKESNNMELYHDSEEEDKQIKLWNVAERKHPWYDPPPKVKVRTIQQTKYMHYHFGLGGSAIIFLFLDLKCFFFFFMFEGDNEKGYLPYEYRIHIGSDPFSSLRKFA